MIYKRLPILRVLPFLLFFSQLSVALADDLIQRVEIRGNVRVEEASIRIQIKTKPGTRLQPSLVEADIKEIYRTGFFDQVTAKLEKKNGTKTLVFEVLEKPAIRNVFLEGNEQVDEETLKEKLNINARRFLDRTKINASIEQAKAYYASRGYYGTQIHYDVTPVEERQVDLTLHIEEGKKKILRKVIFEGNQRTPTSELSDIIKTSSYSWWSSWITGTGTVTDEQLDNDVKALTNYFLTHGYVDVKVSKPVVEEIGDKSQDLHVTFKIYEGDVYSFQEITATGTLLNNNEAKTLEGIESKKGEVFNIEKLRHDTFTVSEKFTDIGYAFANVVPQTEIDRDRKAVRIDFQVDKGALVGINRINVTGNKKTGDNVIRRTLKIQEGEIFSSSKIKKSQELLQRLGYFDEVTITPDPSAVQDEVVLTVAVREGSTGTFSVGAGVTSGEGFVVTSRVAENNILGTGRALSFDINSGSQTQNYILSFDDPRVNDSYWSFSADALSVKRQFDDFDRKEAGGALGVGYPLWFLGEEDRDDIRFSLKYELLDIDISNVVAEAADLIKRSVGTTLSSSVTPQLVRNTIDNPLDPHSGSRQIASVEIAGLGGDQEFWLGQLGNTVYYPLWKSSVGPFLFSQRSYWTSSFCLHGGVCLSTWAAPC